MELLVCDNENLAEAVVTELGAPPPLEVGGGDDRRG